MASSWLHLFPCLGFYLLPWSPWLSCSLVFDSSCTRQMHADASTIRPFHWIGVTPMHLWLDWLQWLHKITGFNNPCFIFWFPWLIWLHVTTGFIDITTMVGFVGAIGFLGFLGLFDVLSLLGFLGLVCSMNWCAPHVLCTTMFAGMSFPLKVPASTGFAASMNIATRLILLSTWRVAL